MPRLKSANHHWWPESLSQFWLDKTGFITRFSSDGNIARVQPASACAIHNAHHIKFDDNNPWNSSFESSYGKADGQFSDLVCWLLELSAIPQQSNTPLAARFTGKDLSASRRKTLAECLASLIVRSPATRHRVKLMVEDARSQFGASNYEADKTIMAANLAHFYKTVVNKIERVENSLCSCRIPTSLFLETVFFTIFHHRMRTLAEGLSSQFYLL